MAGRSGRISKREAAVKRKASAAIRAQDDDLPVEFYTPSELPPTEWYSSGIPTLDALLGGGLPAGRIVEIYGPFGIGKTLLSLQWKPLVFVDIERTAEREWFHKFAPEMEIVRPKRGERVTGEVLWRVLEAACLANLKGVVVVDSVGAIVSEAMLESRGGQAPLARHVTENLKRLIPLIGDTTILFINQIRMIVGSSIPGLVDPPGGKFLGHVTTQMIEMRWRGEWLKYGERKIGHAVRVYLKKSKVGPCERECILYVGYGTGIHESEEEAKEAYKRAVSPEAIHAVAPRTH